MDAAHINDSAISLLAHPTGFVTGAILYAMILVLVIQISQKPVTQKARKDTHSPLQRLSLGTALLGLLWNLCGLAEFILSFTHFTRIQAFSHVLALSALGFLPAVVIHSFLESGKIQIGQRSQKVILTIAYSLSAGAAMFNVLPGNHEAVLFGVPVVNGLVLGFVGLIGLLLVDTVRQHGWDHHARVVALVGIAAAFMPLNHHESGDYVWWVELVAHHASLPLAVAILYQDYRFVFGDIVLKHALSFIGLVGVAMGLYVSVGAPLLFQPLGEEGPSLLGVGVLLSLWVGTALVFPYLVRGASWFVDAVVLKRPNYEAFRQDVVQEIMKKESPNDILDTCCEMLKPILGSEDIEWFSTQAQETEDQVCPSCSLISLGEGGQGKGFSVNKRSSQAQGLKDVPKVSVMLDIPSVDPPHYKIRIGRLPQGRRLLSDDFYHLESLASLVSRRITAVRVAHERCQQVIREEEMKKLASESELRALRAQLNPHFLFNALTTIGYLIQTAPTKATETLMRLTDLLRGVLKRLDREFTTLGHELDLVQSYLHIEQSRFEDRLSVHINIPESFREVLIPALTLQPLVENAVKHGIQPSICGGVIQMTAAIKKRHSPTNQETLPTHVLAIQVWDTGVGVKTPKNEQNPGTGLGIANIRKRLWMHYEEGAVLDIQSHAGKGTIVNLEIQVEWDGTLAYGSRPTEQRERVTV